jgi:hypothetical protein
MKPILFKPFFKPKSKKKSGVRDRDVKSTSVRFTFGFVFEK